MAWQLIWAPSTSKGKSQFSRFCVESRQNLRARLKPTAGPPGNAVESRPFWGIIEDSQG